MKTPYRISFVVPSAEKLGVVLGLIADETTELKVEQIGKANGSAHGVPSPVALERPAKNYVPKNSIIQTSILRCFPAGTPFSLTDAANALEKLGFSPRSASPGLSRMKKAGLVERLSDRRLVIRKQAEAQ